MKVAGYGDRREPDTTSVVMVSAILFSVHCFLSLPVGNTGVPFGIALLLAMTLMLMKGQKISWGLVGLFILITLVGSVGAVTGPHGPLSQRLSTTAYFVTSIFTATVLYNEISTWPVETLRRFFLTIALVLIIGAFLEPLTPLAAISDAFREAVHVKGVYLNDTRDVVDTGIVRPKFFATEPSSLAQSIGIVSLGWVILAYEVRWRLAVFTALILAGLAAVRSPTLFVFFPPGVFYCYMSRQPNRPNDFNLVRRLLLTFLIGVVGLFAALFVAEQVMATRLQAILAGTDGSIIERLFVPPLLTYKILSTYPMFGLGFGGKNFIVNMILDALGSAGGLAHLDSYLSGGGDASQMFPISSLEYWATFGLVGGSIVFYLLSRVQRMLAPGDGMPLLVTVLCASLAGAYVGGTYFWTFLALFGAAGHARWRDAARKRKRRKLSAPSAQPAMGTAT